VVSKNTKVLKKINGSAWSKPMASLPKKKKKKSTSKLPKWEVVKLVAKTTLIATLVAGTIGFVLGRKTISPHFFIERTPYAVKLPKFQVAKYDPKQVLGLAALIARKNNISPKLLQGIVLQESLAGKLPHYDVSGQQFGLGPDKRYYGLAQIKLVAAWQVLNRYPYLLKKFHFQTVTDEEVIAKLIYNPVFNLTVAAKYIKILKTMGYHSFKALATAYNLGPGGAQNVNPNNDPYAQGVLHKVDNLRDSYARISE
jgi:soluble lytic murein transglycosylase-like protein